MSTTDTHKPPLRVAKAAEKGLALREKFQRGGTQVGINRAKQLKAREALNLSTVKRMFSYFRRHSVDKNSEDFTNEKNPSRGYIAWLLWGGDAGYSWVKQVLNKD